MIADDCMSRVVEVAKEANTRNDAARIDIHDHLFAML
jgi:hypothetical protein